MTKLFTFILSFLLLFLLTYALATNYFFSRVHILPENSAVPPAFPVLVTWQENGRPDCEIINHDRLADHPLGNRLSLRIAPEQVETCREKLLSRNSEKIHYDLTVTETEQGQTMSTELSNEFMVNIGWYEVTDERIIPHRHKLINALDKAPMLFLLSLVVAILGAFLVISLLFKRRQVDPEETNQ